MCLTELGHYSEAGSRLEAAYDELSGQFGDDDHRTRRLIGALTSLYDVWGKPEKAAEWRAKLPTEQEAVATDPPQSAPN